MTQPASEADFVDLVERARAGDEAAMSELMCRYVPHVQRIARIRLQRANLARLVDSVDICQSVMAVFLQRTSDGRFQLASAEDALRLLGRMTRNHVNKKLAYHRALRRDVTRVAGEDQLAEIAASESTPSLIASRHEMMAQVRELLSEKEQYVWEKRAAGHSWADIAREVGVSSECVRKRADRAAQRVKHHLDKIADHAK